MLEDKAFAPLLRKLLCSKVSLLGLAPSRTVEAQEVVAENL